MTKSQTLDRLDFDHWLKLAKSDPDSFEAQRSQMIDEAIGRFAHSRQVHLRRVQWRIDRIRERSRNPMAACIAISSMMWDSFNNLNSTYRHLYEQTSGGGHQIQRDLDPLPSAKVLAFRPRTH